MPTLQQFRENLGQTWEHLTEGWRHLAERTNGALTRFTRNHWKKPDSDNESAIMTHSARWGLMAAEVYDEDKRVIVKLEAPGMEADDFDIQVYDDVLVVRGEKRIEREEGKGEYYLLERAYGRFERAIPLPSEVDHDKAKAKYRHGILQITLPKSENRRRSNRIRVSEA